MEEDFRRFEFNYASFKMEPYARGSGTSSQLLKEILLKLRDPSFPNDKKVIDRFENRTNAGERKLIIVSNRYSETGTRVFGRIALIKNKAPLLLSSGNIVEEIEKEKRVC